MALSIGDLKARDVRGTGGADPVRGGGDAAGSTCLSRATVRSACPDHRRRRHRPRERVEGGRGREECVEERLLVATSRDGVSCWCWAARREPMRGALGYSPRLQPIVNQMVTTCTKFAPNC